jgi:hypothetical protein
VVAEGNLGREMIGAFGEVVSADLAAVYAVGEGVSADLA